MNLRITVLLVYLYILQRCRSLSENGKCSRTLSNGDKGWYCCDNHADVNGICVECNDGFQSDAGEACHPCLKGLYGRKCSERCVCKDYQECNNIDGCRNRSHTTVTTMVSELSTSWEIKTSSITPETHDSKNVVSNLQPEMVYIICTGVLSFVVILGIIVLRHNMQQQCVFKSKRQNSQNITIELDESITTNPLGIYDYIDESKLYDLDLAVNRTRNNEEQNKYSSESSSDVNRDPENDNKSTTTLSDDYLQPQACIHAKLSDEKQRHRETGIEVKAILTNTLEYNNIDDNIVPMNSDKRETLNVKEDKENASEYLSMHARTVDVHRPLCEIDTVITTKRQDSKNMY